MLLFFNAVATTTTSITVTVSAMCTTFTNDKKYIDDDRNDNRN